MPDKAGYEETAPSPMSALSIHLGRCEVDLAAREVRHDGQPRPVEPRAFGVLAYLVHQRHRVVTKKELLEAVWPGQDVTEGALARAVMKARQAIGDTGEPALIRTVPRVGYRLVAPAMEAATPAAPVAPAASASAPLRIALLPFDNDTGDASLEWVELGLMSLVAHALGQDARLSPVAMPSLLAAVDGARRVQGADPVAAVQQAAGAQLVVRGRVARHEQGFELSFDGVGTPALPPTQVQAASAAELGPRMAGALATLLFPGAPSDSGVLGLDSNDPMAIAAFARGLQAFARQKYPQAVNLLRMALELAPGSPAVQLELLRSLAGMGDLDAGKPLARRLLARAERTGDLMLAARVHLAMGRLHSNRSAFVPAAFRIEKGLRLMGDQAPPDELAIAYLLRSQIATFTQDKATARRALEQMRQVCERSSNRMLPLSCLNMQAAQAWVDGDYEQAAELAARAAREAGVLHAHRVVVIAGTNCAEFLALLGRWAEAAAHVEEALAAATLLDDPISVCLAGAGACWIYRLTGTPAASERIASCLPATENVALLARPWKLQALGHHAAASGDHEAAARWFAQAMQQLREGENRLNEQETWPWYLCSLVRTGRLDEAEAEVGLALRPPHADNTEFQRWLLHSRALVAHAAGRPQEALAFLLQLAAAPTAPLWRAWGVLDAAWLQAEAGRPAEALRLLQQLPPAFAAMPLAHAVAARAHFAAGDRAAALQAQQRYLEAARHRSPQPCLSGLGSWYEREAGTPPPAPCLPSRL
jgi:DNA-binding winged helix-turn-helix (wHTH) protein/tetratricopeptide (TPR) repeat protein